MFSVRQKREISEAVQKTLQATNHPELPEGEIQFCLHVDGAESWSWADIRNNGVVPSPDVNPGNERQDRQGSPTMTSTTTHFPPDFGIAQLMRDAHETAIEKGWWDGEEEESPRSFPEQIALMHSELSEVLEEFRQHGLDPARFSYAYESYRIAGKQIDKPEGIAVEFADLLIRVADTCQRYKIPLVEALRKKMEFNRHRPYRHGGKKA